MTAKRTSLCVAAVGPRTSLWGEMTAPGWSGAGSGVCSPWLCCQEPFGEGQGVALEGELSAGVEVAFADGTPRPRVVGTWRPGPC